MMKYMGEKNSRKYILRIISNIVLVVLSVVIMTYTTGCGSNHKENAGNIIGNAAEINQSDNGNEAMENNNNNSENQSAQGEAVMLIAKEDTSDDSLSVDDVSDDSLTDSYSSTDDNSDTDELIPVSMEADSVSYADINQFDKENEDNTGEDTINVNEEAGDGQNDMNNNSDAGKIIICIDPGHGGSNEGTKETYDGTLVKEKNLTLTIARKLKYYLEQNDGIKVVMTRDSDKAVSLAGRIEYANANNADYVISVHINSRSSDDINPNGCMMLMSCSRYQPSCSRFDSIYDRERSLSYSIISKLNGLGIPIANDNWNADEYNEGILQRVNTEGELYPDGSMADYYGLINEGTRAGIPTVIVEHAFLSNESDYRSYMSTDSQLDALARADAAGILEAVLQ